MRSACWALEKGISVVICNGMAENAVRNIIKGRKLGTFFTDSKNGGVSVESAAEQGEASNDSLFFFFLLSRSPPRAGRFVVDDVSFQALPAYFALG